jgi:hypothetical protein
VIVPVYIVSDRCLGVHRTSHSGIWLDKESRMCHQSMSY